MIYDWQGFLSQWNAELLASEDVKDEGLASEVATSQWFGFPGATEEDLTTAEARLGRSFPPSYREFLQFSNGWRQTGPFIYHLWPSDQVDWFRVRNQAWIDTLASFEYPTVTDAEYLVYGSGAEQPERIEYLRTALQISDIGDSSVYLLNPQIITPQGEWEAWFLASWSPSIDRYPSFWDMMQAEYRRFRALDAQEAKRFRVKGDPQLLFTQLPNLIDELNRDAQFYRQYLPMRSGLLLLHDNAIIHALELTSEQVHLLSQQFDDPALLLDALRQLARELEHEQHQLQNKPRQGITRFNYWDLDYAQAAPAATDFGRAEGLRQVSGKIDWFINER